MLDAMLTPLRHAMQTCAAMPPTPLCYADAATPRLRRRCQLLPIFRDDFFDAAVITGYYYVSPISLPASIRRDFAAAAQRQLIRAFRDAMSAIALMLRDALRADRPCATR